MEEVSIADFKRLWKPDEDSHKAENGRLLIIAGSELYHGASILPLKVASRIVDLVYFFSVPENNEIVKEMKSDLPDFIVVPRDRVMDFMGKVDCVLIGPGLPDNEDTQKLTEELLKNYPDKKFVLDAGSLSAIDPEILTENCIVTPHKGEFEKLFGVEPSEEIMEMMCEKYGCVIVLKGPEDLICSKETCKINKTGNVGMTKGGTGDVLSGLIAALACKNDLVLAVCVGNFVNGLAGDRLKERLSRYYNASDLVEEIPKTMKWLEEQ